MSETVDFVIYTAAWCPVSSRVVKSLREKWAVREVDVDKHFGEAEEARILSIPTILALVDGVEKKRLTGVAVLEADSWAVGFLKRRKQRKSK